MSTVRSWSVSSAVIILVIVEGFCLSLDKERDSLEHVHSGLADSCLEKRRFPLRVTCIFSVVVIVVFDGRFIGVNAPTPGLQTECKASAFPAGSEIVTSRDTIPLPLLLPLQGVKSGQRSNNVNRQSVV
jgi:hypothetical protein